MKHARRFAALIAALLLLFACALADTRGYTLMRTAAFCCCVRMIKRC